MPLKGRTQGDGRMHLFLRLARVYLRPHLGKMILALAAALISSLSSFTLSYLSKIMVDDVLQIGRGQQAGQTSQRLVIRDDGRPNRDSGLQGGRARDALGEQEEAVVSRREGIPGGGVRARRIHLLWMVFLGYVALRLFFAALSWGYSYGITKIGQEIVFRLRQDVYNKLQSLQVSYFDRYQTGKIMARVMDDVNAVQWSVSGVFIHLCTNVSTLIAGAAILFYINARLAALAFLTLPFYVIVYQFFVQRIRMVNRMIRERNAAVYGVIGDSVSGVRVVMSFARELRELRRFFNAIADFFRLQIRNSVYNTALSILCGLISGVGSTLVVYYGILSIQSGRMTLGEFLYFYGSVGLLFSPVVALSNMNINIQWVMAALHRVFDVLDEEVVIEDPPGAIHMDEVHGEVVFHSVSLRYDENSDRSALQQIGFAVFPGQMVCLVGPSGAGKTSIFNLLLRLYEPTEGRITVDGEDIHDIALSSLRRHIRMVPQEPMLFSGTLAENIRYGQPDASPEDVVRAAKAAELHDFVMSQPGKYETHIGEGGVSLSGGQKQRMALAMTLITNPSVLMLDDSTSALDAKTESRVHQTLERIMEGRTSFVITHKVSMARVADLVLVLKKGRVVEWGTHERLVAKRGAYYELFETQLSGEEKGEKEAVPAATA